MSEDMADQVATFMDSLIDWSDCYDDISNTERLEACRSILEEIRMIEANGYRTLYGVYSSDDHFTVVVVVFFPEGKERDHYPSQFVVPRRFTECVLR